MTPRIDMPDALVIPTVAAASLRFVGPNISARDAAYAITIAWLAANRPDVAVKVPGSTDLYDIPDNGLRQAIGVSRRENAEKEGARHDRFAVSFVHVDGIDWAMPVLASMHTDAPNRMRVKNLDRLTLRWKVSAALVRSMTVKEGEPTVAIPMHLIRNARNHHSVMFMAWVGAWFQGYIDPALVYKQTEDSLIIRIKYDPLLDLLWRANGIPVSNMMRDVLQPVADEIEQFGDHVMAIEPRRTRYKGGRLGKVLDIQIGIHRIVTDATVESFEDRVRRLAAQRVVAVEQAIVDSEKKPSNNWRRPIRSHRDRDPELPFDETNVVAMPIDKMRSTRPAIDQQYSEDRFAVVLPPGHKDLNKGDA